MDKVYKLGLDIGSTTIKVVLLDGEKIIHSDYQRHHSDVSGLLNELFEDLNKKFPGIDVDVVITGSGGLSVANWLGFKFTQEVMAETQAIKTYHPETDVIIELGGEDAKITYMHPVLEQRMNGTCAGGTGAFIDQMASLLQTDAAAFSRSQTCSPLSTKALPRRTSPHLFTSQLLTRLSLVLHAADPSRVMLRF